MSALVRLLCCCLRPVDEEEQNDHDAVIPNERTRLIDPEADASPPTDASGVSDQQKLLDRFGTIVRAKEGRMVSVSSRAPFDLHDAEDDSGSASTSDIPAVHPPTTGASANATSPTSEGSVAISRRPPVLTMTPARVLSQDSLRHYEPRRSLSRTSSRSSSRVRGPPTVPVRPPHSVSSNSHSHSQGSGSGRAWNGHGHGLANAPHSAASEWFAESESGSSVGGIEEEPEPEPSPPPERSHVPASTPVAARPIQALAAVVATPSAPAAPPSPPPPHDLTPKAESTLPDTGITFDWD